MRAGCILIAVLLLGTVARGDSVRLNDGTIIVGDLKRAGDGWDVYDPETKKLVRHITAEQVATIEVTPRGDPKQAAVGRLISLRRSVEALSDLKVIIDRFEKFIEQNKGTPAAEDAKKDLAQWMQRREQGMVKMGAKWVRPEEKGAVQEKALAIADQARQMLKQNRLKDAETAVTQALATDPSNITALYLKGLILFRQEKVQDARKAFEAVKEIAPDHGPTLNNLAVVLWRQNQHVAALNMYLLAMQAMPNNKDILNNVAEALNALSEKERSGAIPQKVFKVWTEQDTQLQAQMMPLGFFRWGGTWVDKAQFEKLQTAEKEVKDKIEKLENEFADAQRKLDDIAGRIQSNIDAMNFLDQNRRMYDNVTRQLVIYPLPAAYWDYDRANRQLESQRKETLALMDALRAKAQVVKQQVPIPKFTGVQLVVGVEGTPVIIPADKAGPANLANDLMGDKTPGPSPIPPVDIKPETRPAERPLKY